MKRLFICLFILMNVLVLTSCIDDSYTATLYMMLDESYFDKPVCSIKIRKSENNKLLKKEEVNRLFHMAYGDDYPDRHYKIYYEDFSNEIKGNVYVEKDSKYLVVFATQRQAPVGNKILEKIESNRNYLVSYHKNYVKEYGGLKYKYQNCIVIEDSSNLSLVKELDNNILTEDLLTELLQKYYDICYQKPLLIDSGLGSYFLYGPFADGDRLKEVHLLKNIDGYTNEQILNYEVEYTNIEFPYTVDSDVMYFQLIYTYE